MKLQINFDLIRKINEANGNFKLQYNMLDNKKYILPWFSIYTIMNLITGDPVVPAIGQALFTTTWVSGLYSIISNLLDRPVHHMKQYLAIMDIIMLSLKLNQINIETSPDLLMESEEYDKEYKIVLNEQKIPQILQNKYILVPTYNNGEIKDEYLVQEHILGTKEYTLSKGRPAKQFKLAHSNT